MTQLARKHPVTPRWGWSGGAVLRLSEGECASVTSISPSDDASKLRSIVNELDSTSDPEHIEAELLGLRAAYHRCLRQDEFGPSREEQLCALREVKRCVQRSIDILERLPQILRDELYNEFIRIEAFAPVTWFDDKEIRALLLSAQKVVCRLPRHEGLNHLHTLSPTLDALIRKIRLLDTNSQATFFFSERSATCRQQIAILDTKAARTTRDLLILRAKLKVTIEALEAVRGPDSQRSLTWLVFSLCDLWRRETGLPVGSVGWKDGNFDSPPTSPCAKFVAAVVEMFQPTKDWCEKQPVQHKSILIFTKAPAHRARRIHYLMREYVRLQPQADVPRRRPRMSAATL